MSTFGRWTDRLAFSEEGGYAYVPGDLIVPTAQESEALEILRSRFDSSVDLAGDDVDRGSFSLLKNVPDPPTGVNDLRGAGIDAQPNHVVFSHSGCCGPHPSLGGNLLGAYPFSANPFSANPFSANPFSANPFSANPFSANASDYQPNALALLAKVGDQDDAADFLATGHRQHSARPAKAPGLTEEVDPEHATPSILVIDTGIATELLRPHKLIGVTGYPFGTEPPEEHPDEDADNVIDPVAGHGTFIAGVIERIAPECDLRVHGLLTGYGDASEDHVAQVLDSLTGDNRPDILSLSFGGYALVQMARLAQSVQRLIGDGTVVVASAGNDSTCQPSYPAAFPGVISVGAIGPCGPAFFTNYGPWVRSCAPGMDVVSTFFTEWTPPGRAEKAVSGGWVRWSGTSFSAPAVVGALARAMKEGLELSDAVYAVIDSPSLMRIPGLGTVVNQGPHWTRP